ncbi:MAG: DNA polymerase III subunit chi [Pseudomonadota bacterium]
MTEVLYYHLVNEPLENVLPKLLEKCLERGWRVVVQTGHEARVEALNQQLWTYREESFLPHGSRDDGNAEDQPIFLTDQDENPNEATIRFLIEGTEINDLSPYERVIYVFNGHDEAELAHARSRWKIDKEAGHEVTYWAQNERGGWEKKA